MFASKDTLLTRPSGYNIARSVRTRSSATAYFNRTFTTPTNNKIFTWSGWLKLGKLSDGYGMLSTTGTGAPRSLFVIDSNTLWFLDQPSGTNASLNSVAVLRDPSAWYHIVFAVDTTQATSTNRVKMYINGVQSTLTGTYPTQNTNPILNSATAHTIGSYSINYFDGYMTEINFIDGQALTPSSFGETDSITGVWKPKAYSGTYGTNGFELNFSDNSNNTAATIGKDYSGNGNNWTPNNISVTAGATYDSMQDVPTLTSATAANYNTLNPTIRQYAVTPAEIISNGNLTLTCSSAAVSGSAWGTMVLTSGKWYFENTVSTVGAAVAAGFSNNTVVAGLGTHSADSATWGCYYKSDGNKVINGSITAYGATYTTGNVIGVALDIDAGSITFYKDNASQGTITGLSLATGSAGWLSAIGGYNGSVSNPNFGQRPFTYTPPTGFVALNTYNLPASTITNGAAYMAATLYTGTGASLTVANTVGSTSFQPDWVWIKVRSTTYNHNLFDSVRGVQNVLNSNASYIENVSGAGDLTAFNSNGFTIRQTSNYELSANGATYVAWQWKAGTTSASNTNGTITSTVSVGATQGFSVVTYTGTGTAATIGHGLGVAPSMIIIKSRPTSSSWIVYHSSISPTNLLTLQTTGAQQNLPLYFNSTSPTSSVFSIGSAANTGVDLNVSSSTYVAYCFAAVAGYSAFGSYTGNGSADGPFIYTGFRPRWIMIKCSSTTGNWIIWDSSRGTYNVIDSLRLYPNLSDAEGGGVDIDFVSNGFKFRNTNAAMNGSGSTYIYMAFAENPFRNALAR